MPLLAPNPHHSVVYVRNGKTRRRMNHSGLLEGSFDFHNNNKKLNTMRAACKCFVEIKNKTLQASLPLTDALFFLTWQKHM
jgi:hypothetical protein